MKNATTTIPLPLADVNIIVVTDVHSWIAGQRHKRAKTANYGDVLSFYRQVQKNENANKAFFFVNNGDFMDGTGLSSIPPTHLLPLLEKMPWDAVNLGNHELYHNGKYVLMETT